MRSPLTLHLDSCRLSDEQFYFLCQDNRDLRFERDATGDLTIMSPTGGETGYYNAGITSQLWNWNQKTKLGMVFDSSTGFKLPNGAERSPDASWLRLEKWHSLTPEQRQKFLPLCPDFAIELRSPSDSLSSLQEKMREYLENGMGLGWLINRQDRQVEVYRQGSALEVLEQPQTLSGEGVLLGFELDLSLIW